MATAQEIAEDQAAVEAYRAKYGDERAAQFEADLYKLRRTPPPQPPASTFSGFPRWLVILFVVWVALLETADKLPRLLLAYPGYEATLAEFQAKMLQPALTQAQLDKANNEAKASAYLADTASVQLDKARFDAKAAQFSPDTAAATLDKTKQDAKAASFQPALVAAQAFKAEVDSAASGMILGDGGSSTRISNMFDLLDPNHPGLVSRGILTPNVAPLVVEMMLQDMKKKAASEPAKADPPKAEPTPTPTTTPTPEPTPSPAASPTPEPSPTPTPTPLRTPTMFDCAKASMGADYVICGSPELMDAEARLEDIYNAARNAKGDSVRSDQIDWIKRYGPDCGLPLRGRPSDIQITLAADCVKSAIEKRIRELRDKITPPLL